MEAERFSGVAVPPDVDHGDFGTSSGGATLVN